MQPLANESAIIAQVIVNQDGQAFEQLVKYYQQSVRQYCRRLSVNDFSLADDLAQETFWQAFRKIAKFEGRGKFQSWLFSIAYFQFLQHLRAKKNYDELDESLSEEAHVDAVLIRKDLEVAMTKLKTNERACLTLQYSFGYSQEEVSQILHLPLGTVKSHCRRGKERLSIMLAVATDTSNTKAIDGAA
ncbi:RNA polymerase sigma factor [Thalassotalea sp. M1531]|uniref:RNA polymerase sigma factor n=1 Tax=Thalassotalea algicola TaxID=2716224 RepID=A0A7Y0LBT7_9GAMM|nr:RNA polymerase sigma factor [Thalassotalea algicola]NMP31680.1 RNA polymerase sigma factor [Thalassotalea algicola]